MGKKFSVRNIVYFSVWMLFILLFTIWTGFWLLLIVSLLPADYFLFGFIPYKKISESLKPPHQLQALFEWLKVILFALLITVFIKTFFVEAYKIPTPSMEKTLLVGDYLFVSKIRYGPKIPNTPLSVPFMPNMLPGGKVSYSDKIQLPYKRLQGLAKVNRNDIIVFNFPEGDTVVVQYPGQSYYYLLRRYGRDYIRSRYDLVVHPVDKRENYIKRCTGLPRDTLRIHAGKVYINDQALPELPTQQFKYYVRTQKHRLPDSVMNQLGVDLSEVNYNPKSSLHVMPLSNADLTILTGLPQIKSIQRYKEPLISFRNTEVFPHSAAFRWTADEFGPLIIPGKGLEIDLNITNISLYRRIIEVYEKNKLEVINNRIYINDQPVRSYTFKMDYYFVLGDNWHNSADSRFWGFVPENHLVGKAIAIWYSKETTKGFLKGIRFNRMFKSIK